MKILKTSTNILELTRKREVRVGILKGSILTVAISGYGCGGNYQEITAIASERRSYTSEDIDIQLGTRRCNFPWLSPSRHFLDDFLCFTDLIQPFEFHS